MFCSYTNLKLKRRVKCENKLPNANQCTKTTAGCEDHKSSNKEIKKHKQHTFGIIQCQLCTFELIFMIVTLWLQAKNCISFFSLFIVHTSVWCWMKNSDKQYFIRDLINRLKVLIPTSQVPHLNQYLSLYNHTMRQWELGRLKPSATATIQS